MEGYRQALAERGIEVDDSLVAQGLFTYRSGLDAAEELLEAKDPPSAIFASNDDMAAATVAVAHRRGLDVPGDLTVVGFDDSALATTIWPELTTIHQPIADMSRAAVDLLAAMLRDKRSGVAEVLRQVVLDYTLIRRQSDAAPRRRPAAPGVGGSPSRSVRPELCRRACHDRCLTWHVFRQAQHEREGSALHTVMPG